MAKVYSLPTKASQYISDILSVIKCDKSLNRAKNIFFTGDFNVNLLNYKQDREISRFLDNLLQDGQLPLITHPTRIASRVATLLDFISVSNTDFDYNTGILTIPIADHFPVFYVQNFKSFER